MIKYTELPLIKVAEDTQEEKEMLRRLVEAQKKNLKKKTEETK